MINFIGKMETEKRYLQWTYHGDEGAVEGFLRIGKTWKRSQLALVQQLEERSSSCFLVIVCISNYSNLRNLKRYKQLFHERIGTDKR